MDNGWKNFFKENLFLFLVFFVVVFGFLGLTIYNAIRDYRDEHTEYVKEPIEEVTEMIRSYEANEYKIISKDDQDLAEYYLKQLVTIWDKDPGKLYDLMTTTARSEYTSREDAINKLNELKSSKVLRSAIDSYKVEKGTVIILTDQGIEFKLNTNGINDYKITFMGQI
jgi:hypothetical protein